MDIEKPSASGDDAHIVSRYDQELVRLRELVAEMGALALRQIRSSVEALAAGDVSLARNVIAVDSKLNNLDIDGKEKVAAIFAIRAPVARDMRLVLALYNVADLLERAGDEAKNIASTVVRLFDEERLAPTTEPIRDVTHLADLAASMLERALKALEGRDLDLAVEVVRCDVTMNSEFRSALRRLSTFILEDTRNLRHSIDMVGVFTSLEGIGDCAKAVSENLIYAIKGKDIRHMHPDSLARGGYLDT